MKESLKKSYEAFKNKSPTFHIVGATATTICIIIGGLKLNDSLNHATTESYFQTGITLPKEIPSESLPMLASNTLATTLEDTSGSLSLEIPFSQNSFFPLMVEVCTQSEEILGLCAMGYVAFSKQ